MVTCYSNIQRSHPHLGTSSPARPARIHFLNNLRSALTALLIAYHAAFPGARGSVSVAYHPRSAVLPLALDTALQPAFFLVSGATGRCATQAKGSRAFLARRVGATLLLVLL